MRETSRDGRTVVRTGIPDEWRVPPWHQVVTGVFEAVEVRRDFAEGRLYTSTQSLSRGTSVFGHVEPRR